VIRLSRMTDYGVVVMSQMSHHDGTMTAPELAQATGLPVPTVSKLLKQLAKSGLVESHRGVHGGYSMARDLDDINAMEIIEALDGPVALTDCVDGAEDLCNVQSLCPMRGGWDKVNRAVRKALTEVSLAELCPPRVFLDPLDPSIARPAKKRVAR
jgi:FeS assembly SUF system regulator